MELKYIRIPIAITLFTVCIASGLCAGAEENKEPSSDNTAHFDKKAWMDNIVLPLSLRHCPVSLENNDLLIVLYPDNSYKMTDKNENSSSQGIYTIMSGVRHKDNKDYAGNDTLYLVKTNITSSDIKTSLQNTDFHQAAELILTPLGYEDNTFSFYSAKRGTIVLSCKRKGTVADIMNNAE
jgi:hypothetical protein